MSVTEAGQTKMDLLLKFPVKTKPLEDAREAKARLDAFFGDTYDDKIRSFYHYQTDRIVGNSKLDQRSAWRDRTNLYIYGPGGTGKTTSAKAFAEAQGLPFCLIEGSTLTVENLSEKILYCLVSPTVPAKDGKPYLNTVIMIDELDHLFLGPDASKFEMLIKPILSGKVIYAEKSGLSIDASYIIFIGAGNGPLKSTTGSKQHQAALDRRWHQLEYMKADLEHRQRIGEKFYKDASLGWSYDPTPEQAREDRELIAKTIVPYDHQVEDGVGGLKEVINALVLYRKGEEPIQTFQHLVHFERMKMVPKPTDGPSHQEPSIDSLSSKDLDTAQSIRRIMEYLLSKRTRETTPDFPQEVQ